MLILGRLVGVEGVFIFSGFIEGVYLICGFGVYFWGFRDFFFFDVLE